MAEHLIEFALAAFGVATSAGGWVIKMIFGKLKQHEEIHSEMERKIENHRLHVAENYSPRTEMKDVKDTIVAHLIRIEDKLDRKADKE